MKKKSTIKLPFPELLYPYSTIAKPMQPTPVQSATQGKLAYVVFSCALIPYLLGLLEVYRYTDSFKGTPEQKETSVGVMRQLMEILALSECTDSFPDDEPCKDFTPAAGFIEYFPNNPYTTPDLIGEGYAQPAWYKATVLSNLVLGTQYGDIVTDISRFPTGSLPSILPASGLPRIRIHIVGEGVIRLYLLNLFAGSMAQITVDDNPLSIRLVDLDRDLIAIPPETSTDVIEEIQVNGAGNHHIDIIIVSQVNEGIPYLHHGGGLRKIELCGFDGMEDILSPIFRFTEACILEVSYDGIDYLPVPGWAEFALTCFQGADGAPGQPGQDGAPGQDISSDATRCRVANALGSGFIDDILNPVLLALVLGYANSETPEGLKSLVLDKWFTQDLTEEQESALDFAMFATDNLNNPDGAIEIYRSAIVDTAFREEITEGLYCWLCPDGGIDLEAWPNMAYAIDSLHAGEGTYQLYAIWLHLAMNYFYKELTALVSDNLFRGGCVDCSSDPCADWDIAFGQWTREFHFNDTAEFWFPEDSGGFRTKWVATEGFMPYWQPAGSGNHSCILIRSDGALMDLDWIEIGLNTGYEYPGHLQIRTQRNEDGLWQTYDADFPAGTDFFAIPYGTGVLYDHIEILITRSGESCIADMAIQPAIRYVILKGQNPTPF